MTDQAAEPYAGWGQMITRFLKDDIAVDAGSGFTLTDPKLFPFDVNIVGTGRTTERATDERGGAARLLPHPGCPGPPDHRFHTHADRPVQ